MKREPILAGSWQNGFSAATFWEGVNTARWGTYLSEIECEAINSAAQLAEGTETALEVGCEGGRWAKALEDRGWEMRCTDVNPEALKICRSRLQRGSCLEVQSTDTFLPTGDESVSMVLCMEVFPVVHQKWFIDEAWRVLAPGGTLVGAFLNLASWKGLLHRWRCSLVGSTQWYHRTYLGWRNEVKLTGFQFHSEQGICWMPFSRGSDSPVIPIATQVEKSLGLRSLPSLSPWIIFVARKPPKLSESDQAKFIEAWMKT